MNERLPSWREGSTRDAILGFLDGLGDVPVEDRVAYFDNDGTLWTEKPSYVQLDFFVDALQRRAAADSTIRDRPEFAAVLDHDAEAMGEIGIERVALALAGLFDGMTPGEFASAAAAFLEGYRHRTLGCGLSGIVYQPMLELLDELRALDFTIGIVTGGGTEFVRALSESLYGVPAELVVGTLIGYEFVRDDAGRPGLRRSTELSVVANEGPAKVEHIQRQLGRRPIIAGGNSAGDGEMLEWAMAGPHPGLAILVDHDDGEREFAYESTAATFEHTEKITDVADRLGWVTVSMADDWATVFPGDG
ncbi:MAG: HAD family hydrolase [Actinomycetota bacterium]